jgi:hypothetical protein
MHKLNLTKKRLRKYLKKRQIRECERYQYLARDVDTRTSFFCFAFEISQINSIRFAQAIFEHLKENKISTSEVVFQTDNDSEFIGSVFKKGLSGFTEYVPYVANEIFK